MTHYISLLYASLVWYVQKTFSKTKKKTATKKKNLRIFSSSQPANASLKWDFLVGSENERIF